METAGASTSREWIPLKIFGGFQFIFYDYHKTSNISRTLVGNIIVDNSDVVGASPIGAAPTPSSLSTWHLASMDWAKATARQDGKHLSFVSYIRDLTVIIK